MERAFIMCPVCEKQGIQAELYRGNPENHLYRCASNHALTYEQTATATKIKLVVQEKPGPTDVRAEFWIDPNVLSKFREKFPNQQNATVNSILHELCDSDMVLISGALARELKRLKIKTGEDMVANAHECQRLEVENADLVSKLDFFGRMLKGAGMEQEA